MRAVPCMRSSTVSSYNFSMYCGVMGAGTVRTCQRNHRRQRCHCKTTTDYTSSMCRISASMASRRSGCKGTHTHGQGQQQEVTAGQQQHQMVCPAQSPWQCRTTGRLDSAFVFSAAAAAFFAFLSCSDHTDTSPAPKHETDDVVMDGYNSHAYRESHIDRTANMPTHATVRRNRAHTASFFSSARRLPSSKIFTCRSDKISGKRMYTSDHETGWR